MASPLLQASVLVVCFAWSSGCPSTQIAAAAYDRTCTADADCVVVAEGDACGCLCPNTAIRADQEDAYDADLAAAQRRCNPLAGQCAADCVGGDAVCTTGTCQIRFLSLLTDAGTADGG